MAMALPALSSQAVPGAPAAQEGCAGSKSGTLLPRVGVLVVTSVVEQLHHRLDRERSISLGQKTAAWQTPLAQSPWASLRGEGASITSHTQLFHHNPLLEEAGDLALTQHSHSYVPFGPARPFSRAPGRPLTPALGALEHDGVKFPLSLAEKAMDICRLAGSPAPFGLCIPSA